MSVADMYGVLIMCDKKQWTDCRNLRTTALEGAPAAVQKDHGRRKAVIVLHNEREVPANMKLEYMLSIRV